MFQQKQHWLNAGLRITLIHRSVSQRLLRGVVLCYDVLSGSTASIIILSNEIVVDPTEFEMLISGIGKQ